MFARFPLGSRRKGATMDNRYPGDRNNYQPEQSDLDLDAIVNEFKDYTPDELYKISEIEAKKRGFTISSEAVDKVLSLYSETAEDPRMGNGRYCRNMVESAILNYAYRNYCENTGHQSNGSSEASKTDYILKAEDFEPLKNMEKTTSSAPIGFRG